MSAAPRSAALVAAELTKADEAHRMREQDGHRLSEALSAAQTAHRKLAECVFIPAGVRLTAEALEVLLADAVEDQRDRTKAKADECARLYAELETIAPRVDQ